MKNFIIIFEEKEGTSPLVRLLHNFKPISIVHQIENSGWEPFDRHNCGSMTLDRLESCLELIWNEEPIDMERLNDIYTETAQKPLESIDRNSTIGFKMRLIPPNQDLQAIKIISHLSKFEIFAKMLRGFNRFLFRQKMFELFEKYNVVVLLAVRQDLLRWALSKYHGDGSGKKGHLQFKLAKGEITRDDIGKILVDLDRLEKIILDCERSNVNKQKLMKQLKKKGVQVYPIFYEDFLNDKIEYFRQLFKYLDLEVNDSEIETALFLGSYFQKVHSNDISSFVVNHAEVLDRFSDRFFAWR